MIKWFLCNNDIVDGPFTRDELIKKVGEGLYPEDILVWGKEMNVWKPYTWWLENHETVVANAIKDKDPRKWHFAFQGVSQGPLERTTLIEELKKLEGNANDALIWTKGMTNWSPIFEFHDIMDEVGVNRRQYPRASAGGKIVLFHGDQYIVGELASVSEGGFGAKNFAYDMAPGLALKVELVSDNFTGPIHATAQVRYLDSETVGFKFTNINRESQAQIISYVKEKNFDIINSMKAA